MTDLLIALAGALLFLIIAALAKKYLDRHLQKDVLEESRHATTALHHEDKELSAPAGGEGAMLEPRHAGAADLLNVIAEAKFDRAAEVNVPEAGMEAPPTAPAAGGQAPKTSQAPTPEDLNRLAQARSEKAMEKLSRYYISHIAEYQAKTMTCATGSFYAAIGSATAGFVFMCWGANKIFSLKDTDGKIALASGGLIAAIGGAASAYIAKTFLDIHRMSLEQLDRFFIQLTVNDDLIMARRLAKDCDDPDTRKKAYDTIINSLAVVIRCQTTQPPALDPSAGGKPMP